MPAYRDDPAALAALIEPNRVHRDLYCAPDLFALEDALLFARHWIYVGHASQVPDAGDFCTTTIGTCPVIMVRGGDGAIRVLVNRCAHKGAAVVSASCGNAGRALRCPYHAWAYGLDGALLSMPLKADYDAAAFAQSPAARGLRPAGAVAVRHGFVFARLSATGPEFEAYFGAALATLDNLAQRAPEGELVVAGGCLRSVIRCNWKIYVENIVDPAHAPSTHESAAQAAAAIGTALANDPTEPAALEQLLPFGVSYDYFTHAGARLYPNGHAILGTKASLHSAYRPLPEYEGMLARVHGPERARDILSFTPQNTLFFPTFAFKGSPHTVRAVRPLAVDRTLVETWSLLPKGAPAEVLQRTVMYNRLVFSSMSVVAHDDFHVFESIQRSLAAPGNAWVDMQRGYRGGEAEETRDVEDGNDELLLRHFYRAWQRLMVTAAERGA
jgi:phenylpropionate dioxygenase-like ring-hydroxylating dioxygenase large terminal subunit